MKKIIILTLILCGVCTVYSQITQEMYDKKVEEIADLKKQVKSEQEKNSLLSDAYKKDTLALQKQIKELNADLLKLKKIKDDWNKLEGQLKTKDNAIELLEVQINKKIKEISDKEEKCKQDISKEYDKGKLKALANLVNTYQKPFDDLIKSSTKESLQRDMQFVSTNPEVKSILNDLLIYFKAKELLTKQFEAVQINDIQTQLDQIKQKSVLLDELKENVKQFQNINKGLKETVEKIIALDIEKPKTIDASRENKDNKIKYEISLYIFKYDFNSTDYPYLSDILLEIIKRKQSNADANISDLLKKL